MEPSLNAGAHAQQKDRAPLASLGAVLGVFVALPISMYFFDASMISIFAVMIFSAGLVADIFTTKAGFNRGFSDYNVFYNILNRGRKRRMGNNSFLVGGFILGVIRVGLIYYFWNDPTILLLVASLSLLGPFWNSIMLAYPEARKEAMTQVPNPKAVITPPSS